MDTATKLLVLANFLLAAATVGLVIATVVYAKATRRMNKIANRQNALLNLQIYFNSIYQKQTFDNKAFSVDHKGTSTGR